MTDSPGGPIGPGSVLGQYRVLRSIGRGGAGEVFLARDMALGRRVALKALYADRLGAPEAVERFLAEARTTARFSHPHIVTVYGTGMHWGSPFLVLEYLEGETLRRRVDQGPLGLREALRLGRAVADALAELHRHGILHRDLKPENVIIPADGRPRVLDFGLARPLAAPVALAEGADEDDEEDTEDDLDLAGTPPYMAPELWLGRPPGPAADLWAFGVLLYELIDGRGPYGDLARRELIQAHVDPAPAPPLHRRVPEEVAALVAACLDKRPEARPAAERVLETLDDLLEGRGRRGDTSPFRGLMPWEEGDAHRFFGREAEVAEAVEQLRREPALSVVGPSGAGKSSFVHAGVIPRLRERGNLTVLDLRPGKNPLRALAAALVAAGGGRGGGDEPLAVAEALHA
ncbi:MAG: serine/threonine-protein kinase, partial [Pseudomonadota bacterium]